MILRNDFGCVVYACVNGTVGISGIASDEADLYEFYASIIKSADNVTDRFVSESPIVDVASIT